MQTTNDIKPTGFPDSVRASFCDKKPPLDLSAAALRAAVVIFATTLLHSGLPHGNQHPQLHQENLHGNLKGAAVDILSQNIMGGTCARVCPVEALCEQACVRNTNEDKPVTIGELQRHATDWLF